VDPLWLNYSLQEPDGALQTENVYTPEAILAILHTSRGLMLSLLKTQFVVAKLLAMQDE
jgi:hypothetical protein